jgi:hypothetical protein
MERIGQKETKTRYKQHAASICITFASTRPQAKEDFVGIHKRQEHLAQDLGQLNIHYQNTG